MTMDVEVAEVEGEVSTMLKVPVTKAKGFIEIETGSLPEHVYREVLIQGLKVLVNRGQTNITKEAYPDEDKRKEVAMEKAEATLQAMYEGKVRIVGAKADKIPGVVMTEARRIARNLVKEELKRSGIKISHVEASEITKAANALIAADPAIIEQAKEELEKRSRVKVAVDVVKMVPISAKKVKALEAKKADKVISAAKANKVATRGRPGLNA